MYRSFSDRVLGGVCGGLASVLPLNAWWFRALFIVLAVITTGAFAALYLLLWWIIPQESPLTRSRGGAWRLLLTIVLALLVGAGWLAQNLGDLRGPTGINLYWPGLLVALGAVFFLRQLR